MRMMPCLSCRNPTPLTSLPITPKLLHFEFRGGWEDSDFAEVAVSPMEVPGAAPTELLVLMFSSGVAEVP